MSRMKKYFSTMQEATRKYVELAFGVLQRKWGILVALLRLSFVDEIKCMMKCAIILYNIVVKQRMYASCEYGQQVTEGITVVQGSQ